MSVAKNVVENKTVPKAIGFSKKGKSTIFNTWILAAIIAITVYMYIPVSPNILSNNKITIKQKKRKENQVMNIGNWFKKRTNSLKFNKNKLDRPKIKSNLLSVIAFR